MPKTRYTLAAVGAPILVTGIGMVDRSEIITLADELGLQPRVVKKDYVLGWVLAGITQDAELSRAWLFKGSTCLKKCFRQDQLDIAQTEAETWYSQTVWLMISAGKRWR